MADAIVLAGGRDPSLGPGIPNKAFLTIEGRTLLSYVVEALQGGRDIGRIAVVGPTEELRRHVPSGVLVVPDANAIMENVGTAIEALKPEDPVLVLASDIPLVTSAVIGEFLAACAKERADGYYPIVPREVMERRFPGARKTYVKLTDGAFCGGSVLYFYPQVFPQVRPFVERLLVARKQPWQLAQQFGWSIVTKFLSGRLSMQELLAKATEVMGIVVKPVIISSPELALDVDTTNSENLRLVQTALAARQPAR